MLSDSVKFDENKGLSEKLAKTNGEPHNRELKMLMKLLKTGSKDEQRMLAQALLEMGRHASNK
jgi:ubiquinone biosynthesis protein UbiJ